MNSIDLAFINWLQQSAALGKRHYCIKELIDTEWNYLETLKWIKLWFMDPLSGKLSKADKETIFLGIEVRDMIEF